MTNSEREWCILKEFHKSQRGNNLITDKGIEAFLEISEFAKKHELRIPDHLQTDLRFISNAHYDWLLKVNKLIKILAGIPNYKPRIKRFFNAKNYFDSLSALYEIEMALRFNIRKFDVSFTDENTPEITPDIEVKFADKKFNLEITTINVSTEHADKMEFFAKIRMLRNKHKIVMGGIINHVPKNSQKEHLQRIENKILNAKKSTGICNIIEEGKYNISIGGSSAFNFIYKELINIENKIMSIIKSKYEQLSVNDHPGILCIYSGSRNFDLEKLYNEGYDKIGRYIQIFPKLSGLVLSLYTNFRPFETLKHLESSNEQRTFKEFKPGFGEMEQSIIWRNDSASCNLPSEFYNVYDEFNKELKNYQS